MMDFIATGTGRCGTGFVSQVLTRAGMPCGHEAAFTYAGPIENPQVDADSSWMAEPFLQFYDCPALLVVRNPSDVIASLMGIGFFTHNSWWRQFAYIHMPQLERLAPLDAANAFYAEWNRRLAKKCAYVTDIDHFDLELLASLTDLPYEQIAQAASDVGNRYNHRNRATIDPVWVKEPATSIYAELIGGVAA